MKIDGKNILVEIKQLKKILKEIINDDLDNVQFEQWWKLYDKKRSKAKAKKIFNRVINSKNVGELMEHTKQYVKSTPDIQFRKDPSTYLNQESWNDVVIIKTNPEDEAAKEEEMREKRFLEKMRRQTAQYNDMVEPASEKETKMYIADIVKNMRYNK